MLASGAVAVGLLGERGRPATSAAQGPCPGARTVRVVVDPTLATSLRRVAEEASGTVLSPGACVDVEVLAVPSAQTAAALGGPAASAAGAPADHVEVVPLRPLDPAVAGVDQRAALLAGTADLGARLAPGGSGLFDTVLAAVRSVREGDDPDAVSSVVVLTDGAQEDPGAPGLDELVATLGAEADPARPVPVTLIGISPDVDAAELTALAAATGGTAALAEAPEDVAILLAEALRRR